MEWIILALIIVIAFLTWRLYKLGRRVKGLKARLLLALNFINKDDVDFEVLELICDPDDEDEWDF